MKRKALGRGLDDLIPDTEGTESSTLEIDLDRIAPNPDQPRFRLEEQGLNELAASIREHGVLQPVLVRPQGQGFQLVAGERRWAAAQRAGLLKIPAVVREIPDDRLLELALIENIQREQLNAIEEAQAYQNLLGVLNATQEQLAARLGRERSTIANAIRLLKLPAPVKLLVADGRLSPGHARALLAANLSPKETLRAAQKMVKGAWSVRQAERWSQKGTHRRPAAERTDPNVSAAEDRLRGVLATKVEIQNQPGNRGVIRIHFYSSEDLMRIYAILTGQRAQSTEEAS